jgi:hypothetical protein
VILGPKNSLGELRSQGNEALVDAVDCPDCLALPSPARQAARPVHLYNPAEVNGYPGLSTATEWRHRADPVGILARYRLTQETRCIFGHAHKDGAIIRVRCGQIFRFGHRCASKELAGYTDAMAYHDAQERHRRNVESLTSAPSVQLNALIELRKELRKQADYRREKRDQREGQLMARRAKDGARGTEVILEERQFDPLTLEGKTVERTASIAGISFWLSRFDLAQVENLVRGARELLEAAQEIDTTAEDAVAKLVTRVGVQEKAIQQLRQALQPGQEYLAAANARAISAALERARP